MEPIYLDNNSTTMIDPVVAESIFQAYQQGYLNPASQHGPGREARRELEKARQSIAVALGASQSGMSADELFFTSGGTESNNLAVRGLIKDFTGNIVVSSIEHPSIQAIGQWLEQQGLEVRTIPVDNDGVCVVDSLDDLIDQQTQLVSVMLANNETGAIQPVAEVAARSRQHGVPCHTDAVQAVGKMPVSFNELGVDALTMTGHKFHGPRGIGALIVRNGVKLNPIVYGGFQQSGIRPGTEDVALAIGLAKAVEISLDHLDTYHKLAALRAQFEQDLRGRHPEVTIQSAGAKRICTTSNIAFPGVDRQAFVMAADMNAIAVSTGSACASGSSEPSPVLVAMNCSEEVIFSAIRISLSRFTTAAELAEAFDRISEIYKHLRQVQKT